MIMFDRLRSLPDKGGDEDDALADDRSKVLGCLLTLLQQLAHGEQLIP